MLKSSIIWKKFGSTPRPIALRRMLIAYHDQLKTSKYWSKTRKSEEWVEDISLGYEALADGIRNWKRFCVHVLLRRASSYVHAGLPQILRRVLFFRKLTLNGRLTWLSKYSPIVQPEGSTLLQHHHESWHCGRPRQPSWWWTWTARWSPSPSSRHGTAVCCRPRGNPAPAWQPPRPPWSLSWSSTTQPPRPPCPSLSLSWSSWSPARPPCLPWSLTGWSPPAWGSCRRRRGPPAQHDVEVDVTSRRRVVDL